MSLKCICVSFFVIFQLIPYVTANSSSCDKLANCLNDLSNYVNKCGKQLKDLFASLPKNSSNEACKKAGDIFLKFGDLQSVRARDIADCIKNSDNTESSQCPKMNAPTSRRKRDSAKEGMRKWAAAANTVTDQCSNGNKVVAEVKKKMEKGELMSRQQILEFAKTNCDGKLNLTIDDMPVIGGDIKIENAINKVLNECTNGTEIVKTAKAKAEKKEFTTRSEIVDYVKGQCKGKSTLIVDDLPNFYDSKLETAIDKVKKDCSNSKQILSDLTAKYQNKTIFSRQQVVDYVSTKCDGKSTLQISDIPAFYGEDTTEFGKKLETSILKVQKECKNSDDVLREIKNQHDNGQMKTADEIVKYVKANCNGKSTLTVDDIPMGDCSEKTVKSKTQECLDMVSGCSKARYCNECYEISDLHNAIHKAQLDLSDAQSKCPSSNKKSVGAP